MCSLIGLPGGYRPAARPSRHGDASGFTLIEVLIALTIAAVLLTVLLHSFSLGIGSSTRVAAYTEATLIAEATMDEFGIDIPMSDGTSIERPEGRFLVSAEVHLYADENTPDMTGNPVAPYELTVKVSWQEGARQRSVDLRTLRLLPVPQPPQPSQPAQPVEPAG
jgi:general secretion pathway protein I